MARDCAFARHGASGAVVGIHVHRYEGVAGRHGKDLLAGYDGREWFGPHWRCGIIDHNGNLLAPCAYTRVTFLTGTRVQLETPEGQQVVVELENP